ncbi:MAG: hypothetical protein HRU35_03500 [Rickettsiaceae bacterium]|nr:hypothetical protein [Rickettsiaceae bacterium]
MNRIINLKLIILLFLAIIVSSCIQSSHAPEEEDIPKILNNEKSMVIISTKPIVGSGVFLSDKEIVKMWWTHDKTKNELRFENFDTFIDTKISKDLEFYIVNPGLYHLTYLQFHPEEGHTISGSGKMASFYAKPGEVVYLGQIEINFRDYDCNNPNFWTKAAKVNDNFNKDKEKIIDFEPRLQHRIVKRLVKKLEN